MPREAGLVLYDYWRSSAAYRVRIALHLKGLDFVQEPVNLVREGGEQHRSAYRSLNPQGLVPALLHEGQVLTQSLSICEYLEWRSWWPATSILSTTCGCNSASSRITGWMKSPWSTG